MVVNLIEWSNKLLEAERTRIGIEPITQSAKDISLKMLTPFNLKSLIGSY